MANDHSEPQQRAMPAERASGDPGGRPDEGRREVPPSALRLASILNASDVYPSQPSLPPLALPTLFSSPEPGGLRVPLPSHSQVVPSAPELFQPVPEPVGLPAPLPSHTQPSRMVQLIERLEEAPLAPVVRSQLPLPEAQQQPLPTYNRGAWTAEEKAGLLEGYRLHGRKSVLLAHFVPTRSVKQIGDYVSRFLRSEEKQATAAISRGDTGDRVAHDSVEPEVTLVRVRPPQVLDLSADSPELPMAAFQYQQPLQEPPRQQQQQGGQEQERERPREEDKGEQQQQQQQQQFNTGQWTPEEKAALLGGCRVHGSSNVPLLMPFVPTRTAKQIGNYVRRMAADEKKHAAAAASASRRHNRQADSHVRAAAHDDSDSDVVVVGAAAAAAPPPPAVDLTVDDPLPLATRGHDVPEHLPPPQERRSRRAARSQTPADAPVAATTRETIEIHTEEFAGETPRTKAAPPRSSSMRTRVRERPPLAKSKTAPSPSNGVNSDNSDSDSAPTTAPRRKKSKLTITIPRRVLEAAPESPSSSSVASWTSSMKPPARGKKRPAVVEFEGIGGPATAMIAAATTMAPAPPPFEPRACEFCRSPHGVDAVVHCALCKRVYHPKCLVAHFQPFCARDDEPIEQQLAALQVRAPPQVKVKMFRCASCYAMCVESFRSGVYEWACACASCSAPQKLVAYRRRMLLHLMYGGGDAKRAGKPKGSTTHADGDKTPKDAKATDAQPTDAAVANARSGSRRRGRSSASVSESESMEVDSEAPFVEPSEAAGRQSKARGARATASRLTCSSRARSGPKAHHDDDDDRKLGGGDTLAAADAAGTQDGSNNAAAEPEREQETMSVLADGDDVEERLASVAVRVDKKRGTRIFPIVCTESASWTVSGFMKGGQYQLYTKRSKKPDAVCCDCCDKLMSCEQFVSHTDKSFLSADGKRASDFLFASHRDGVTYSPLTAFVALLKQRSSLWRPASQSDKLETLEATKHSSVRSGRQSTVDVPADSATAAPVSKEAAIANASQLLAEAPIVRRAGSSLSGKPVFLVKLVCVAPRLIIRMSDGVIQSKLDSSTPGQAFPYKEGWLSFEQGSVSAAASSSLSSSVASSVASVTASMAAPSSPAYARVLCSCCAKEKSIAAFIAHTGIEDWSPRDDSKFRRHHVFVPQGDNRTMLEFDKVWQAVLLLHSEQLLDALLARVADEGATKGVRAQPATLRESRSSDEQ